MLHIEREPEYKRPGAATSAGAAILGR